MLNPTIHIFWEDFTQGQYFDYGEYLVTTEEICEFGKKYDPLPHHISVEAAQKTTLGVHCASGIHAVGMAQKLLCDNLFNHSSLIAGRGLEYMRMLSPIVSGDRLRVALHVDESIPHHAKPDRGWVTFTGRLYRPDNSTAMEYKTEILFLKQGY